MDDLTATRLCAEAMGWKVSEFKMTSPKRTPSAIGAYDNPKENTPVWYDPLHDDAQCMALESWLIERGYLHYEDGDHLFYTWPIETSAQSYSAYFSGSEGRRGALVYCVANMQAAKVAALSDGGHK